MNLDILTKGQKRAWIAVEEYKKKNPQLSNSAAVRATGMTLSTYSAARKRLGINRDGVELVSSPKKRPKMITLPVPEVAPNSVVAFVGNPSGVVQSVKEFLRGN